MKNNHTWVICAYGESEFLEACILSLRAQTIRSKIICYSSTPLDSIRQLCQTYEIPFYTKEGGGIGKDWNNALSFVDSQYATIAHQDDYYEPTYLEAVLQKIEQFKDVLIAYTDYFEEKNGVKILANKNLKIKTFMLKVLNIMPASHFWRNRVLALGNPISCPAVTYNLARIKEFRFDEKMRVSLDWYAWYKISGYKGRFAFISEKLMCHRIHEESETTKTISDNTRTKEDLYMYQLFWPKWIAKLINRAYIKSQDSNSND
ncbi:glycosyltransferase family 2 protein [Streptococcus intermedius]|uniref:Putative glycosyltransferase n=1 Tax=Streptococcus intermedius B196 TaxID=862967 RepID=T1ZFT2_STRIT|nr:glycosyltransferase family 2 protein [Streptococcus intermedius]AGU76317.1 putative glycosyltransferase [Streptococcus intermedius B196]MDP1433180.1 glycosyltransferase family 2 protein [Streptococcus intermedius]RKV93809.1 MAG: glycosyltransferase [Streptococcus sp.]RSJ27272.1 Glycosyl transferase family 2 [Streptococcus intermedius]